MTVSALYASTHQDGRARPSWRQLPPLPFWHPSLPDLERLPGEVLLEPKHPALFAEQALPIARLDAEAAYGDLDDFRITK